MQKRNGPNFKNAFNFNSSSAYHNRKNIDRSALLEEIEKNKIEEIKLKTFKNTDKFQKPQPRQLIASNGMNSTLTTKLSVGTQNQHTNDLDNSNQLIFDHRNSNSRV